MAPVLVRVTRATGVEFNHIPFRGDPPHLNEVLAGRLDFSATVVASASGLIDGDRLRLIAVFSARRHPDYPNVPTAREQGIDAQQLSQVGIYAPRGTPEPVLAKLEEACRTGTEEEAFRRIDLEYPLAIARLAHRQGTPAFVLNSAKSANPRSRIFYSRVKGELEQALQGVGFDSLTFVRPGLIGGERDEYRGGERVAAAVLGLLHPVLPRSLRINPADRIADSLLEAALAARPGVHTVEADQLA